MANVWVDSGGAATNSGSRDANTAAFSGSAATVSGSVVSLDGSPDLSTVVTSGASQDCIYIDDATNTNQKRFWITAVDNSAKTVTVSVAPTGVTSSDWTIGGRVTMAGLTGGESFLRAGDTVNINNTQTAANGPIFTARVGGDTTSGYVTIKGTSGYPTLTSNNTGAVISGNVNFIWIEGLTLVQQGASGSAIDMTGSSADNWVIMNNRITDAGGDGINSSSGGTGARIFMNEISGCGGHGIDGSDVIFSALFNYIHDNGSSGILLNSSTSVQLVAWNIIESNTDRGIQKTGATTNLLFLLCNTFYGNGNSGFESTAVSILTMFNNIFLDNGNGGTEYNIELATNAALWVMGNYNDISIAGGTGGGNVLNYTLGANDITTDPDFTDAPNGDFSLQTGSPAIDAGISGAIW
jgi:hypothetical protein